VGEREGYHQTRIGRWRPSERQRLVLDALVENKTNPEIAALLGISLDGAKWHVSELMSQTGLSEREELARWWIEERQRRASPLAIPMLLRWNFIALSIGLAAVAAFVLLILNPADGNQGSGSQRDSPVAQGADLAPTPPVTPVATPPIPPAYYDCAVTRPNGSTPPGETPGGHYGDGELWTIFGDNGRLFYRTVDLQTNGSFSMKWIWWTTSGANDFSMVALRLDGPGTFISGVFHPGTASGGIPVWVGEPTFSNPGCWQVTAHLGSESLTVVVFLQLLP
jgi:DNA-binding CsgD family transcriptional regulator